MVQCAALGRIREPARDKTECPRCFAREGRQLLRRYIRTIPFIGATNACGGWYGFMSSVPGREAWAVR